jgi:hypothetical protein
LRNVADQCQKLSNRAAVRLATLAVAAEAESDEERP